MPAKEVAAPAVDNILIKTYERILPEVLWRCQWNKYRLQFGVPFSPRSLSNRAALGTGPPCRLLGRRVYYLKGEFLQWLRELPAYRASVE